MIWIKKKTTYKKLWDADKSDLKRKLIAWNAYIGEKERSQNNFSFHLKKLEKEAE